MEIFGSIYSIFQLLFINPITNLLVVYYVALHFAHIPYAFAFSIILLTLSIRFVLYPLTSAQIRSSRKMQDVAPQISQIKERYKSDRARQQEEIMKVYKKEGINPASGCLPVVVQIPVVWSLYNVLTTLLKQTGSEALAHLNSVVYFDFLHIPSAWDPTFFGMMISTVPKEVFSSNPFYVLVPIVTGIGQLLLSKMMMSTATKQDNKKKGGSDDFQASFQKQMIFIFPLMIGYFSFIFPLGLSLYWNTFTLFGILQQYKLVGWGGLEPWIVKLQKRNG